MFLGRLTDQRSRQLATRTLLVSPRDALVFLLPRCFTFRSLASAATPALGTEITPEFIDDSQDECTKRPETSSPRTASPPKLQQRGKLGAFWPYHQSANDSAKAPLDLKSSREWRSEHISRNNFTASSSLDLLPSVSKTLEEAIPGRIRDLQKSFQVGPVQARRAQCLSQRSQRHKGHTSAKDALLKDKGSWSYDWTVALAHLVKLQKVDEANATEQNVEINYLYGKPTRYYQVRPDQIPIPAVWSPFTFAIYVEDLAESKMTRLMRRRSGGRETQHQFTVRDVLMARFRDQAFRPYITSKSIKSALRFFYRHNLISSARFVCNLVEELGIQWDTEIFNLMLRGAASRKDLHSFTYILGLMKRKGVAPNPRTWTALLQALRSESAQLYVLKAGLPFGILDHPGDARDAVRHIIGIELLEHIRTGEELSEFTNRLDRLYCPEWLSVSAGNKMCHVLGEAGNLTQAVEALRFMSQRGRKPNKVTLHTFLSHCRRLKEPERALKILTHFKFAYSVQLEQEEYHALFMLAWKARYMNLSRVVWRVACLEAAVDYRMQELVLRSLLRNTPEHPQSLTEHWNKTAGKIVAGIDSDNSLPADKPAEDPDSVHFMLDKPFTWSQDGPERERSKKLASLLLARDMQAMLRFRLRHKFLDLFATALEMDQQWKSDNVLEKRSGDWILRHAIKVEVDPRPTRPVD